MLYDKTTVQLPSQICDSTIAMVGQQITPTTLNPLTPKEPPHFAYISTKPLPTKTETLNPKTPTTLNDLLMNTPAFFGVATLAHAFSIPTKLREFCCTLSCYIYQNSFSAFCPSLQFKCPDIMPVQETTSSDGILSDTLQASSMLPHFAHRSSKLLLTKTSNSQPLQMI